MPLVLKSRLEIGCRTTIVLLRTLISFVWLSSLFECFGYMFLCLSFKIFLWYCRVFKRTLKFENPIHHTSRDAIWDINNPSLSWTKFLFFWWFKLIMNLFSIWLPAKINFALFNHIFKRDLGDICILTKIMHHTVCSHFQNKQTKKFQRYIFLHLG